MPEVEKACQKYQNDQVWGPWHKEWDFMMVWIEKIYIYIYMYGVGKNRSVITPTIKIKQTNK